MDLTERLDAMEAAIRKPSFRKSSGKANEVNYWIFDYPPEKELEVRERITYMKNKNRKGTDDYQLVVFDLYDIIIDFLERKNFIDKCIEFEKKRGIERIAAHRGISLEEGRNHDIAAILVNRRAGSIKLAASQSRTSRINSSGILRLYPISETS